MAKSNQTKGWLDNYNDSNAFASPDMVGDGFSNVGRNSSPAWGGQFQKGGKLKFLQPTDENLPEGYVFPYATPSSERAMSIGGEDGEPAYLIPSFKYGKPLGDPIEEFRNTGEHLGGPFKTWQDADKWENETRHPAVENKQNIMFPQQEFQMGGSIPGAVGFTYARTKGIPSEGKYAKKTLPSAQNGKEMQYYQNGLDFQPKTISKNGAWLDKAQNGYQTGDKVTYGTPEYEKAYNKGEVVTEDGQRSPIALDEVVIQNNYKRPKGFWEQSRDKFLKDNKDAGLFEAIGSVATYPLSVGQHALTYAIEDKVQDPSEAWGYNTKEGWLDSPGAFGRNFVDFSLNAGLDPANLVGAGILTKENALSKLGKIPTSIAPELRQGLRTAGPSFGSSAKNITSQDLVNSINEQLAKGLGIKKQDVPLAVSLMKDEKGFLNLNTHIGDELAGSINLRQNEIRPKTFMENILGRKINTPIEQFDNTIGYSKYSDYPFRNMKRNVDDIVTETGEWIPKQYYNSGISGEFNSAINETLKSKGLGNLLSTRSGNQTTLGKQRWDKLVEKGLAEPIGEMHYKMKKDGGIIKDDRGQWDHPGEITEIGSNQITMQGVPYDVLGISDTGDTKLMKPGKDYKFKGKKVTEFPMAKNGLRQEQKGLVNLDDLTNFTNYNKPTKSWLNKYN